MAPEDYFGETFEDIPKVRLNHQALRLGDHAGDGPVIVDDAEKDLVSDIRNPF